MTQIGQCVKINCFSQQTLLLPLKVTCSERTRFCMYENDRKLNEKTLCSEVSLSTTGKGIRAAWVTADISHKYVTASPVISNT